MLCGISCYWPPHFDVATAAFSQKSAVSTSASEVSQKDEQEIRQLEAEILKGEMNSDPVAFEKILADDCLNLQRVRI